MICLLLVGKISKGRETNEHLVSFFLKEGGRRREWCWRRKLLARKKKSCRWFWQISSQNYRIVFSCWSQCLFSVTFFFEGGASVPLFKYASFFTQQHVPWQVLCPEPWDSCWLASWLSAPGLSRDRFQPRLVGDVNSCFQPTEMVQMLILLSHLFM